MLAEGRGRRNCVEDAAGGFPSTGDTCRQDTAQIVQPEWLK